MTRDRCSFSSRRPSITPLVTRREPHMLPGFLSWHAPDARCTGNGIHR